jgi:hypothetical protein
MPGFYHRAAIGQAGTCDQRLQPLQRGAVDPWLLSKPQNATGRPVEHPIRHFEAAPYRFRCQTTPENPPLFLDDHVVDQHPSAKPGMPRIEKLPLLSPLGVMSSSCSTVGDHTGRLANARPVRRRELSKAKSVETSLRGRCWVGSITSTIWLHDHSDGHSAPYRRSTDDSKTS